jgi:hypothetical protein
MIGGSHTAAATSIASVGDVLAALEHSGSGIANRFVDDFLLLTNGGTDGGNLFRCEMALPLAGGAGENLHLNVFPSERYSEFVAALTRDCERVSAVVVHGWPVLSVVERDAA